METQTLGHYGKAGNIITIILFIIGKITLSDAAMIATIGAAFSTMGLNLHKYYSDKRKIKNFKK